ncbi:winged helix-turn-helix domain-containing protein [Anaerohalosphaeraceae bacterium U12dextr]|jgi:hypothetical protein
MKKVSIKIGNLYAMKVGKNTLGIRIMSQNQDGHWVGVNIDNNKEILIKSADRLCGPYRPKGDKTAQGKKKAAGADKDAASGKELATTKPGGLTAAANVLAEANEPLNCQEMVKRMLEKGLWKTEGKTPAATIYAAIIREIRDKGAKARFRKTERGKFVIATK